MNTAESILVIITSSFLVLFLVVAVVAGVMLIKLLKSIKHVVVKAEEVIDSAEAVADSFKNVGGPLAALKLLKNIVELVNKTKHKK